MQEKHRIHLHGPWDYRLYRTFGDVKSMLGEGSIRFPLPMINTILQDRVTSIKFIRSFQWIAKLETGERLFLRIEEIDPEHRIELDGKPVPVASPEFIDGNNSDNQSVYFYDLSDLVQSKNRLSILLKIPIESSKSFSSVALVVMGD